MLMVLPDVEHLDWFLIVPDIHRTCGRDEELRAAGQVSLGQIWEELREEFRPRLVSEILN